MKTVTLHAVGGTAPAPAAPVLLIHGLGQNIDDWPTSFLSALTGHGMSPIRFDNRDVGRSIRLTAAGDPPILRLWLAARLGVGLLANPAYTLADMAADTVALLDRLGIGQAHLVGVSMGGMIAQHLAATWPDRVLSLTSIMSSSGASGLRGMRTDVAWHLLSAAPKDLETAITQATGFRKLVGGPLGAVDSAELATRIRRSVTYGWPQDGGSARQFAAILADKDRATLLARIKVPTLVIHGALDPFLRPDHGRDTAARITGAVYRELRDMGHEITVSTAPLLADLIALHTANATRRCRSAAERKLPFVTLET